MTTLFLFTIGLFVGSFLNVLVDRLPKRESLIEGRSRCDRCKKILKWYDLIPLVSFILLKGRCRYCHTRLSPYYPIVELTTGIIFALTAFFILNGSQFLIIYYLFIVSSLIVVFFADFKYGIIPDKIVFPTIVVAIGYLFLNSQFSTLNYFLSAFGASFFFLLLLLITQGRGMGFGDVKFAFLMGLILGFPNIVVSLYIAFLTGAIVGCILILWRKKRIFGTSIPFGPFLAMGSLIAIFFGDILMQSFLQMVLP